MTPSPDTQKEAREIIAKVVRNHFGPNFNGESTAGTIIAALLAKGWDIVAATERKNVADRCRAEGMRMAAAIALEVDEGGVISDAAGGQMDYVEAEYRHKNVEQAALAIEARAAELEKS